MFKKKNQNPQKLDQRITIKSLVLTSNGMGGHDSTWVTKHSNIQAGIWIKGGNERDQQGQLTATVTVTFLLRNDRRAKAITEKDLIEWNGQQYNIRFIDNAESRALYMEIIAERGVAQ